MPRPRIPRYFTFLLNVTMVFQLPIMAYLVSYHAELVNVLFKGKFIEYSWLLPMVVAFATINRVADPVILVAQQQEKAGIILLSKVFAIYNVVAMLALVPLFGVYGAAVATGTAQAMKNLFVWWHVRETARWTNFRAMLLSSILIWGAVIALCYAMKKYLHLPVLAQLFCGAVVCAVALLAYVRSPALCASDRQILASVFHGREQRILRWLRVVPRQAGE